MKITKQRLKEIIREELSTVREGEWYDDENETRGDRKYRDNQHEPDIGLPTWEGEPFGEYDLEAENEKGRLAAAEELGLDPAEENYVKLVDTLADIFQHHLEEVGMDRAEILRAVEEAEEIQLAGDDEEETLEEDWDDIKKTLGGYGQDIANLRKPGTSRSMHLQKLKGMEDEQEVELASSKADYAQGEKEHQKKLAARERHRAADRGRRSRDLDDHDQSQKSQRRRTRKKNADDLRHSGFGSDHHVEE